MINAEKQSIVSLPFRIAFTFRKLKNLKPVRVRIAKIESFDAARVLVPVRQPLRTSRGMLDFVLAQQAVRLLHVAGDDCNVLEPAIVTAGVRRNWPAFRRKILS